MHLQDIKYNKEYLVLRNGKQQVHKKLINSRKSFPMNTLPSIEEVREFMKQFPKMNKKFDNFRFKYEDPYDDNRHEYGGYY